MSKSPLHALDKKTPICKDCIIKSSIDENTNEVSEEKFKNILRQIDKPFYKDYYKVLLINLKRNILLCLKKKCIIAEIL